MHVIAHRGISELKPENTLSAIDLALQTNIPAVELDVHLLRDNGREHLVVIHDRYVDGTTNGTGRVTDYSFNQLRNLDAGAGERIPTLREALALINGRCLVNIELKTEGTVELVIEEIHYACSHFHFALDDFLVSSFDHPLLVECAKLHPTLKLAALISHIPHNISALIDGLPIVSVNMSINCINAQIVKQIHASKLKVFVYTVDKKQDIAQLLEYGVDGIFSNHPEQAIERISLMSTSHSKSQTLQRVW